MRFPARKFSPSRFSPVGLDQHFGGGRATEMIVSNRVRSPSWIYWPIECRSAVSVTLAGKMPLPCLPLALAVELFPPLVDILQFRLVGAQNFDLLASVVERCCARRRRRLPDSPLKATPRPWPSPSPAHRGRGPRCPRRRRPAAAAPLGVSTEKRPPTSSGMTNVGYPSCVASVFNAPRALSVMATMRSAASLLAVTLLDLGLYKAERDGRLGRRARLRNHDGGDRMLLQRGEQVRRCNPPKCSVRRK